MFRKLLLSTSLMLILSSMSTAGIIRHVVKPTARALLGNSTPATNCYVPNAIGIPAKVGVKATTKIAKVSAHVVKTVVY